MAQVTLEIGGRRYELSVRDGQEAHFERLGGIVDEKARAVVAGMSGVNEARQLLMTALLLADELGAPGALPAPPRPSVAASSTDGVAGEINALAARIERLAARAEATAPAA